MKKIIMIVFISSSFIATAKAGTYYIDNNTGSDSNNGTSESTPWKRAPEMNEFSGTYKHQAGDQFIFKGGVTWGPSDFEMQIVNNGAAGNPDYYGVNKNWYNTSAISTITINTPGSGYAVGEKVTINQSNGSGAMAQVASINPVATVTVNSGGSGYLVGDKLLINQSGSNSGAGSEGGGGPDSNAIVQVTATGSGGSITSVALVPGYSGSGYTTGSNIATVYAGGIEGNGSQYFGSGATVNVTVVSGRINTIFLLNGGLGYTSVSDVGTTVTSGPGTGLTLNINICGPSFCRPVFNGGLTTLGSGGNFLIANVYGSYITIDNIELTGHLDLTNAAGSTRAGNIGLYCTDNLLMENLYVHNWTLTSGFTVDGGHGGILGLYPSDETSGPCDPMTAQLDHSVISNQEDPLMSGVAVVQIGVLSNNTIHDVQSNILFTGDAYNNTFYDIDYPTEGFDASLHINTIYIDAWWGNGPKVPAAIYNNVIYNVGNRPTPIYPNTPGLDQTIYVYNNLMYGPMSDGEGDVSIDPFCYGPETDSGPCDPNDVARGYVYVFNNTFVNYWGNSPAVHLTSRLNEGGGNISWLNSLVIENNHIIGSGAYVTDASVASGLVSSLTTLDNLIQSPTAAASQGYTLSDLYAPINANGSTISAGLNLTGTPEYEGPIDISPLTTLPGQDDGILGNSRPPNGNWNIGAYEYSTTTTPPAYELNVTNAGSGFGMVFASLANSIDIINCGVNLGATICSATVNAGTEVTLTATPATGSVFSGWSGACSGTGSCTVTMNAAQSVTANFSASASTSGTAPSITAQPANVTVSPGSSATFTVAATAALPLSYQWKYSTGKGAAFTNISGGTSATHTTSPTTAAYNGYEFECVVTDASGSVTSHAAILTVNSGVVEIAVSPSITTQPVNVTVTAGTEATFTVAATGTAPLSYQWEYSTNGGTSFTNVSGGTSATHTTSPTTTAYNGYEYKCVVTNGTSFTAISNAATLTVNPVSAAPIITAQPVNVTVPLGDEATFTVAATGTAPLTYQWEYSTGGSAAFSNIQGATGPTHTSSPTTAAYNGYEYKCVVTNSAGRVTSSAATLTVGPKTDAKKNPTPDPKSKTSLSITTQPVNATVTAGDTATFKVAATGWALPTLSYQWQYSADKGATFTNIEGATNAIHTSSSTTASYNGYEYRCVVTHGASTVTSDAAILTVEPALDIIRNTF